MRDIPTGRKWLEEVAGQLGQCRVVVWLLSSTSLSRPWVNIELGAGWIKGRRVIPLCHSGLLVAALPRPIGDFIGLGLDQSDAPERLLVGIADGLGLGHPGKRLDFEAMLKDLRAAVPKAVASRESSPPAESTLGPDDHTLEQVRILQALASALNEGRKNVLLEDLPVVAQHSRT
jgi:hypothetical protein